MLFTLVGAGAPRDTPVIALRGRPSDRGLRVEAARGPTAAWSRVFRLLTEPLARMHPFHRPAPAFIVEPSGDEERHEVLERIAAVREIACGGDGPSLACRSTLSGSALRRAWVGAVGPLVDGR
ncbi:MAG: hypothetical protein H5U40_00085 [Polyangiaceae bacterium]|nr:hypothetical protein [Polyangiaceae bacterium]